MGLAASLSGCLGYDGVVNRGAIVDQRKAEQVKPGMPAQQVMQILGTPSTTSTIGGDAWYYVSQRIERSFAFMPQNITDQRVLAVYFDKSKKVQRVADYGMEDGKPIDFLIAHDADRRAGLSSDPSASVEGLALTGDALKPDGANVAGVRGRRL